MMVVVLVVTMVTVRVIRRIPITKLFLLNDVSVSPNMPCMLGHALSIYFCSYGLKETENMTLFRGSIIVSVLCVPVISLLRSLYQ